MRIHNLLSNVWLYRFLCVVNTLSLGSYLYCQIGIYFPKFVFFSIPPSVGIVSIVCVVISLFIIVLMAEIQRQKR